MRSRIWLALTLLLSTLVYLPGLNGPFLFDDAPNLNPVQQWSEGQASLLEVVFGNESGRFGRPIAMLSFVAGAAVLGTEPAAFKLGNLAIHLASGLLLFLLLRRIEARLSPVTSGPFSMALIATAIWLLHPMLASTVLYSVQRMAMLSAMFSLAALLIYVIGRERIEQGATRSGSALLLAGVPSLVILATLSKENGLLAFWLCIVLEWSIFRPSPAANRPYAVRAFGLIFGLLPLAAAILALILFPEQFFSEYGNRHFTLFERLLTQGRVLWDYVGGVLLPNGGRYSLYREDYLISKGLLSPRTTLLAWTGWALLVGVAIKVRKKMPGFTFGVAFFLVAHAMESSIFPLLIYFEHRNYLASIGLIWAVLSLLHHFGPALSAHLTAPRKLGQLAALLIVLVLAAATFGRSLMWQSEELLVEQTLKSYPDSRHARLAMARIELNRFLPDLDAAQKHYEHLLGMERSSTRMMGQAGLVASHCHIEGKVPESNSAKLFVETPESIEADFLSAAIVLRSILEKTGCDGLEPDFIADRIVEMLERAGLPENSRTIWQLRFEAARLFDAGERPEDARRQARIAWAYSGDRNVGLFLLGLEITTGAFEEARILASDLKARIPSSYQAARATLSGYMQILSIVDPRGESISSN